MQANSLASSLCLVFRVQCLEKKRERIENEVFSDIVGVFNGEGPPVPIPNTEVKLTSAENTCLATDWKDSSTPTQTASRVISELFFRFWILSC